MPYRVQYWTTIQQTKSCAYGRDRHTNDNADYNADYNTEYNTDVVTKLYDQEQYPEYDPD
jgi:hypothetical protein